MIRGCLFSPCSRYIYLLASRTRYKSFIVKYSINAVGSNQNQKISFLPILAIDVHDQAATGMRISRDGSYISVSTSDGYIKVLDQYSGKMLLNQKRHNLPTTCCVFTNSYGNPMATPTHIITGSADYTYNLISIPQSYSGGIFSTIFGLFWQIGLFAAIVIYLAIFLPNNFKVKN